MHGTYANHLHCRVLNFLWKKRWLENVVICCTNATDDNYTSVFSCFGPFSQVFRSGTNLFLFPSAPFIMPSVSLKNLHRSTFFLIETLFVAEISQQDGHQVALQYKITNIVFMIDLCQKSGPKQLNSIDEKEDYNRLWIIPPRLEVEVSKLKKFHQHSNITSN